MTLLPPILLCLALSGCCTTLYSDGKPILRTYADGPVHYKGHGITFDAVLDHSTPAAVAWRGVDGALGIAAAAFLGMGTGGAAALPVKAIAAGGIGGAVLTKALTPPPQPLSTR